MKIFYYLYLSLRPYQWIKNGFVLLPLVFAQKLFDSASMLTGLQAVAVFCLLTSSIYLVNDYLDQEEDRNHPFKRNRPLAAGLIRPGHVLVTATALFIISLTWGFFIQSSFFYVLLTYLILQILYNIKLRDIVILDVFSVSAGFFLRIVAGSVVIRVPMSRWLIICSILLALFLILSKRRHELIALGRAVPGEHRKVLSSYSTLFLDQMIGITTGGVLLSYLLYCTSPETVNKFRTENMIYTFPFVLYGIFRYLYLIYLKKGGGSPERIILADFPLLISVLLWVILCTLILNGVI
jgi:4-hydroxybenzoate polyprenyltransferase